MRKVIFRVTFWFLGHYSDWAVRTEFWFSIASRLDMGLTWPPLWWLHWCCAWVVKVATHIHVELRLKMYLICCIYMNIRLEFCNSLCKMWGCSIVTHRVKHGPSYPWRWKQSVPLCWKIVIQQLSITPQTVQILRSPTVEALCSGVVCPKGLQDCRSPRNF
jgi:hypothetical protein